MACGACRGARTQWVQAARRYDIRGVAHATAQGFRIGVDKMRGVDVDAKYGDRPVVTATPYKRPPERSQ